jgi:signal transduction histidine kinase
MQQLDSGTKEWDKNNNQQALTQAKNQAERIRQLTERELKRARMAGLGNTTQRFDPREELPVLIEVLKQAHRKNELEVKLHIADSVKVFGDREDMLELLGNLMDNACKWAKSKVICTISITANITGNSASTGIIIEDDGVGKEPDELVGLAKRGIRLDESVEGHGLGLAISKDIVKLYGGTIRFDRSEKLGGFLVEIKLP